MDTANWAKEQEKNMWHKKIAHMLPALLLNSKPAIKVTMCTVIFAVKYSFHCTTDDANNIKTSVPEQQQQQQ